jgi:serine/threonine-protein kinase HipA
VKFLTDQGGEAVGREACRRLGFVIASGNNDAHLKNWSRLWGAGPRPSLTPCYDFVATVAWPRAFGWEVLGGGGPTLPLRFGNETHFRLLDAIALDEFAKRAEHPWVLEEFFHGIDAAFHAWPTIAEGAPEAMREAVEEHWEKTPCLRDRR